MNNEYEIRGDVAAIFLRRRDGSTIETLIDTRDLPRVQEFPNAWCACWHEDIKNFYVEGTITRNGKSKHYGLHRWLTKPLSNLVVDHRNHNTLDNRMDNLRVVTEAQNNQNYNGLCKANKSGYRGVYWQKKMQKWRAHIMIDRKQMHLGYFTDRDEAGRVALEARKRLMPFAVFN